jgi:hypothetical protein
MPVVGEKNPGRQLEKVQRAGQQPEVSPNQLCTPGEQAHGDEEISAQE